MNFQDNRNVKKFQAVEAERKVRQRTRTIVYVVLAYLCGLVLPLCVVGMPRVSTGRGLDLSKVWEGREIFLKQCADCHGEDGSGVFGPDLTDQFWLHGYTKEEVQETITNGVPGTGMPPWGKTLNSQEIESISEFVLSLSEPSFSTSRA